MTLLESEVTNNRSGNGGQHKYRTYRGWLDYIRHSRPSPLNPQTYDLELVRTVDEIEESFPYLTAFDWLASCIPSSRVLQSAQLRKERCSIMRSNGVYDNYRVRTPSPQPTQDVRSGSTFPEKELFTYVKALGRARNRLEARAEELTARAKVLDDRMKDIHDLYLQCNVDHCLFPDKIEPAAALPWEQHGKEGAH